MEKFETKRLPEQWDVIAPDSAEVRILLGLKDGGMAHFELPPSETSIPQRHKTVEEIWYFLTGRGEMWRKLGDQEEVVEVDPGICLTIPVGAAFQFRSFGEKSLTAIGVTMPPWPGMEEAITVEGKWERNGS